jgi:hypothetical protein
MKSLPNARISSQPVAADQVAVTFEEPGQETETERRKQDGEGGHVPHKLALIPNLAKRGAGTPLLPPPENPPIPFPTFRYLPHTAMTQTMLRRTTCLCLAAGFMLPAALSAQTPAQNDSAAKAAAKANTLPLITTRTLKFTTSEGTWISLDLAPDGSDPGLRAARRPLHPAGHGRRREADHQRPGLRHAAELLARREAARVRERPERLREPLDLRRRRQQRPRTHHW